MKDSIILSLHKATKVSVAELENMLEIPPKLEMGDFAFPCFSLAKVEKRNPLEIAKSLAEKLRRDLPKEVTNVAFTGGYVNFFVDKSKLAKEVLANTAKKSWGRGNLGSKKSLLVEFSQPNTHKAFHVGHIRGTSIGEALSRIAEALSFKVVRTNYSGDTGMHIAKWLWCYEKFHSKEAISSDESWIASIYVDAVKRLSDDESLQDEVDEINRKLEDKSDQRINELWKVTRKNSIDSWNKIYEQLGAHFDKHYFESETELPGKSIAEDLYKKGVAKKDDAIFMDLKDKGKGVWVLLRKDGTVLYSAKDLALAVKKTEDFKVDSYLVVVGDEQRLHFEQLVETLHLMGFKRADDYNFLTFGMVRLPEGKMSSRTGNNVLYSDFVSKAESAARASLDKRGCSEEEIVKRAPIIAISAIKYSMLKQDPKKSMVFDPNEALSFEGDTGPYLLYSFARANTLLKKVKSDKPVKFVDLKDEEVLLLKKIESFPDTLEKAYNNLAPNLLANYCFELASAFNEFYHACPVRGSIEEGFRLKLVDSFRKTLGRGLELLGIETLEEM